MIVAIGGGDQARGETRAIDGFCLAATKKAVPQVLFLPTGTKDAQDYVASVEAAFRELGAEVSSLLLTRNPSSRAVDEALDRADLVYVGGGSAPLIAKHAARYGLGERLAEGLKRGVVLAGMSGGAIALFQGGTGAYNGYRALPGWGLAPGFVLPHFRAGEQASVRSWFSSGAAELMWGVEDGAALAWDGLSFHAVTDRPGAGVWRITAGDFQQI